MGDIFFTYVLFHISIPSEKQIFLGEKVMGAGANNVRGGLKAFYRCRTVCLVIKRHLCCKQLVLCKFHGFVRCVNLSDQTLDLASSQGLKLLMRPFCQSQKQ